MVKDIPKTLETIADNASLALLVLGLVILLIGAAGSVPFTQLQFPEIGWKIFIASIGACVTGGAWWKWHSGEGHKHRHLAKCNFKITSVAPYGAVHLHESARRNNKNYYDVRGQYDKKPPEGYSVAIIEFDPGSNRNFRLRKRAAVYDDNTWHAKDIYARQAGIQLDIAVAYVGASGEALWHYYDKVRSRSGPNGTPSIDRLTEDIRIGHHISVTTRR